MLLKNLIYEFQNSIINFNFSYRLLICGQFLDDVLLNRLPVIFTLITYYCAFSKYS